MEPSTPFESICNRFYDRIEKDEKFFNYYNVDVSEAISIAERRAKNYLLEVLDELSGIGGLQVDFSDYDSKTGVLNFKLYPYEMKMVAEMMFLIYMKRDEALLHAMEVNFTPSDLTVFSPANERTSYRNFIKDLEMSVEAKVDDYKNRDRDTRKLKQTIDYALYGD